MSRLTTLANNPRIVNYSQGKAQDTLAPVADFLAPTVETTSRRFRYWAYDSKNRFTIPNTRRAMAGPAATIRPSGTETTKELEMHALDEPLDDQEIDEAEGENLLMEAADEVAAIGGLAHEKEVLDLAVANAANMPGYGEWSNKDINPVTQINKTILQVMKAAPFGSQMQIGVLFGPNALITMFDNPNVQKSFNGAEVVAPTLENVKRLLIAQNIDARMALMVLDTAVAGKAQVLDFMFDNKVLIFARMQSPTRRDPSFMKTFRLRGKWMVPSTARLPDDRGELVKFDWNGKPIVTNSEAAKIITLE